jgi:hypothetical protein
MSSMRGLVVVVMERGGVLDGSGVRELDGGGGGALEAVLPIQELSYDVRNGPGVGIVIPPVVRIVVGFVVVGAIVLPLLVVIVLPVIRSSPNFAIDLVLLRHPHLLLD